MNAAARPSFRWILAVACVLGLAPGVSLGNSARVNDILRQMPLHELIRRVHGEREPAARYQGQAGYLAGDRALGLPALRFADGPPGVLTRRRATALTCTMGLAATFSRRDAYRNGLVVGRDARALGIQVALQPFINLMRDPAWVRAYNTYGEDPLLTGEIGAAVIRGIQSQGVMAEAKHFIAYDGANDVVVGGQALHEIYAEPFRYAVRAGVASIMCSYNRINGYYACDDSATLRGLLRDRWRFDGFVTSDWGATHSASFINSGLDLEMPGSVLHYLPCYFCATVPPPRPLPPGGVPFAPPAFPIPEEPATAVFHLPPLAPAHGMLAAISHGTVRVSRVRSAARRILLQMRRFGWLGHADVSPTVSPVPFAADLPIVEQTAEDAAVLLKNDRRILPLTARDLRSLALIGPGAGQVVAVGQSGERSLGFPDRDLSPLQALRQLARRVRGAHIRFAVADDMTGVPVPAALLSHAGQPGLIRIVAGGKAGPVDRMLDFTLQSHRPLPPGSSQQWRGSLDIPRTGTYWLYLQLLGCSGELRIDRHRVAASANLLLHGDFLQAAQDNVLPTTDNLDNVRVALRLAKGRHRITVTEHGDASGRPVQVRLNWLTPAARVRDLRAAIATAKRARTAIVFAWSRGRPAYTLPGHQNRLIEAIAAVNPRTIVVLNTSQPVALPWLHQVRAVLQMWYPGDGGGLVTANLLSGRADPSGHLPFTWGRALAQYVSHDPAHPDRSSAGVDGVTHFSEGIFIGYRWFDQQKITPLFPFGYGLSYTRFNYSALRVRRTVAGGLRVRFVVRNVGHYPGTAVPQVYLGAAPAQPGAPQFAVRALAAFTRVPLAPGASRAVALRVPLRQLQYWSTQGDDWRLARGRRSVYVASSSRSVELQTRVALH